MSTLALLGDEDVAASGWDDNSTFVFEFPPASFMLIGSVIDNTPAIMGADASAAAAAGVSAAEIEIDPHHSIRSLSTLISDSDNDGEPPYPYYHQSSARRYRGPRRSCRSIDAPSSHH